MQNTLILLAALALPVGASTAFQINFADSPPADSAAYTGDASNWVGTSCGTSASDGGYAYCQGELLGDLLTGTRASVTSPSLPFSSNGFQFDILDAALAVEGILTITPEAGCLTGGVTVTCGVGVELITSLNGGALSNTLISLFSSYPGTGSAVETGANQTAFNLTWSNGRTDAINFAGAVPEPSTIAVTFAALSCLAVARFRKKERS